MVWQLSLPKGHQWPGLYICCALGADAHYVHLQVAWHSLNMCHIYLTFYYYYKIGICLFKKNGDKTIYHVVLRWHYDGSKGERLDYHRTKDYIMNRSGKYRPATGRLRHIPVILLIKISCKKMFFLSAKSMSFPMLYTRTRFSEELDIADEKLHHISITRCFLIYFIYLRYRIGRN